MHTILGAGGVIANGLADLLTGKGEALRWVSRNPGTIRGAESFAADISDPAGARAAIRGSSIVYLAIGLKYDYSVWRKFWPPIMDNVIDACAETGARLVFLDNVYMYGKVEGPMTEETLYNPCSRKGDLRARLATSLMSAVRKGRLETIIARSADFYGPGAGKSGVPNILVFDKLAKGKKPQWLANPHKRHSFTYTPDAAKGIILLAREPSAWNQVWHLPTAKDPLTGAEFIRQAAAAMNRPAGFSLLKPWMLSLAGIFNRTVRELNEMNYQYAHDYLFDSSRFERTFDFRPTGYREGILATAASYTGLKE